MSKERERLKQPRIPIIRENMKTPFGNYVRSFHAGFKPALGGDNQANSRRLKTL